MNIEEVGSIHYKSLNIFISIIAHIIEIPYDLINLFGDTINMSYYIQKYKERLIKQANKKLPKRRRTDLMPDIRYKYIVNGGLNTACLPKILIILFEEIESNARNAGKNYKKVIKTSNITQLCYYSAYFKGGISGIIKGKNKDNIVNIVNNNTEEQVKIIIYYTLHKLIKYSNIAREDMNKMIADIDYKIFKLQYIPNCEIIYRHLR